MPVALNAGTAAKLSCGYWLIVADDDAIAQGEVGTAPIMALVGGSAVTVKSKAATPKVQKHVLEDSTAAWQKAADATVADDLYWRLSATVPAGAHGLRHLYGAVRRHHERGARPLQGGREHARVRGGGRGRRLTPSRPARAAAPQPSPRRAGPTSRPSAGSRSTVRPSPCAPAT